MKSLTEQERQELIECAKRLITGSRSDTVARLAEISLAALATPPAPSSQEGWKLVPVEPTEEMIEAGDRFMEGLSRLGDAYEAMIAAAPAPEPPSC